RGGGHALRRGAAALGADRKRHGPLTNRPRRGWSRAGSFRADWCGLACYLRGMTASFMALTTVALTRVFAGILISCPVAGFRPVRALLLRTVSFTTPGSVNSPDRLISFSARAASSSNHSRTSVRLTSDLSAKGARRADLGNLWA